MKSKARALRTIATETHRKYYAAYDPYVNRELSIESWWGLTAAFIAELATLLSVYRTPGWED